MLVSNQNQSTTTLTLHNASSRGTLIEKNYIRNPPTPITASNLHARLKTKKEAAADIDSKSQAYQHE
jgi:hypothetical protein